MRRVPVKATSYVNKWGTRVYRSAHRRRVPESNPGSSPTVVRTSPARTATKNRTKVPVVVLILILAVGVIVAVTVSVNSASGGTQDAQANAKPMTADTSATYFKNAWSAFLASGYRHIDFAVESDSNCEQHSYGQVEEFFKSNPCEWLTRAYLAIHDGSLGEVLVALSWVGMPNASSAAEYKKLVDTGGTGNITELSRDTGPYRAIKYDRKFYTSGLDGSSVYNVELQPVGPIPTTFVSGIFNKFKQ